VAAACLAAAVGPAFATSSASATFGNLVITLTDLNPNERHRAIAVVSGLWPCLYTRRSP
jgi:hypothetical protein